MLHKVPPVQIGGKPVVTQGTIITLVNPTWYGMLPAALAALLKRQDLTDRCTKKPDINSNDKIITKLIIIFLGLFIAVIITN